MPSARPSVKIAGPDSITLDSGSTVRAQFVAEVRPTIVSGKILSYAWSLRTHRAVVPTDLVTNKSTLIMPLTNSNVGSDIRYGSYNIVLRVEFENLRQKVATNKIVRSRIHHGSGVLGLGVPGNFRWPELMYEADGITYESGGLLWDDVTDADHYQIQTADTTAGKEHIRGFRNMVENVPPIESDAPFKRARIRAVAVDAVNGEDVEDIGPWSAWINAE